MLVYIPSDRFIEINGADSWINYYDRGEIELQNTCNNNLVKYISAHQSHKWPGVIYNDKYGIYDKYQYVIFMDNDVIIDNLELFSKIVYENNFEICQPSTSDKNVSHRHLIKNGNRIREVPFCEIMSPCIRIDVLKDLIKNHLHKSESGWGLDLLWGKLYKNFVVDTVIMHHTRPVNSGSWIMGNGLTPFQEMQKIKKDHGLLFDGVNA